MTDNRSDRITDHHLVCGHPLPSGGRCEERIDTWARACPVHGAATFERHPIDTPTCECEHPYPSGGYCWRYGRRMPGRSLNGRPVPDGRGGQYENSEAARRMAWDAAATSTREVNDTDERMIDDDRKPIVLLRDPEVECGVLVLHDYRWVERAAAVKVVRDFLHGEQAARAKPS